MIRTGEVIVDDATYTARLGGRTLDLTFKEFELLKYLAQHPGRVFTRQQLLQEVWGYDYFGGTRTVDVHVRRLRAKLGPENETLIGTVRNVGYRFVLPPRDRGAEGRRDDAPAPGCPRSSGQDSAASPRSTPRRTSGARSGGPPPSLARVRAAWWSPGRPTRWTRRPTLALKHDGLASGRLFARGCGGRRVRLRSGSGSSSPSPWRCRRGRGRGPGGPLAAAALASGQVRTAWSHGDHPAAAALAARLGFRRARELWVMRRSALAALPGRARCRPA